jgi:hypothetical protein
MNRLTSIGLIVSFVIGGFSQANDCCTGCGHKLSGQVMCQWKTVKVLRYKVEAKECPPPCDCCCDDRCILGCCKPIRRICLVAYEEEQKFPVRRYVVQRCHNCECTMGSEQHGQQCDGACPDKSCDETIPEAWQAALGTGSSNQAQPQSVVPVQATEPTGDQVAAE